MHLLVEKQINSSYIIDNRRKRMASIYAYIDYRKFLIDTIAEKKLASPGFSCRQLAGRLGISAATLVRILGGKRNVSKKLLPKFIDYFKLRERAAEYFSLLVEFAHVKGAEKRNAAYQKILDFRSERIKSIQPREYSLFEKNFLIALREIIDITGEAGDFQKLAKSLRPEITAREAEKGVAALLDSKMIARGEDKRFHASEKLLTTGEKWENVAIQRYQRDMIRLAESALMNYAKEERDISTVTIGASADEILKIKEILRRARQEILAVAENSSRREYVYQLNFQLFPMSARLAQGENNAG
jgi:uncharacterized protein (TIGR02147 family)